MWGFIILRGIRNLSYYAAKDTLEFLGKRNVKMIFLIDRDERAEEEINKIREILGANVVLYPTRARELENNMMVPRAIAEYIAERKADGTVINAHEIEKLLETKATELKGYTVLKHLCHHLRPIYPERNDLALGRPLDAGECGERFLGIVTAMQRAVDDVLGNLGSIEERVRSHIDQIWGDGETQACAGYRVARRGVQSIRAAVRKTS